MRALLELEIDWNRHNTNAVRFRRSGAWSAEVLDTSVDHAAFGQHHSVRQYGRAIVFGGRRTRTDAALRGPTVGRHTTVPVGPAAAPVGRRVGFDTDDRGGGGRPGAQRRCRTAATTAAQLVAATKQQHHQRGSDIRRDGTLKRRTYTSCRCEARGLSAFVWVFPMSILLLNNSNKFVLRRNKN